MPKLVITEEGGAREVVLASGDTLGRTSQNAIVLNVPEASRTHCRFTAEKGVWFVEDQGSSNGTLVNGRRVSKFELQDGDVVQVGKVTLRFLDAAVEEEAKVESAWGDDEISLEDDVFLVLGGAGREGEIVRVPSGRLTVGRNAKNLLVIKDSSVSGDHGEITREGSRCIVKDLGSSNGTFVNDRRVEEADLEVGDVLRFGAIPATFGVGDPRDFAAPAAAGKEGEDAFTRAMQVGDVDDDPTFELHGSPPQKEGIWNLVALVMVVALGAGVFYLMTWEGRQGPVTGGAAVRASSNLLPELAWSFEIPEEEDREILMWEAERSGTDATGVSDPVKSGTSALRLMGTSAGPALALLRDAPVTVSPGSSYVLSAAFTEASAPPIVGVVWVDDRPGEVPTPFARDLVFGVPGGDGWVSLSGVVIAPAGATKALAAVGVDGSGEATFDDVSMSFVEAPPGRTVEREGFRFSLGAQGTLRVSRYLNAIIDALGIEITAGDQVLTQDQLVVADPAGPAGAISGTLRGDRGDIVCRQEVEGGMLVLALSGSGLASATALRIPLANEDSGSAQVILIRGDEGRRLGGSFKDEQADALILGRGSSRVRISFAGPDGARTMPCSFDAPDRGQPVVRLLLTEGLPSLALRFQLTFEKEEQEARSLLNAAREAVRLTESGRAVQLCEQVMARFPFEESVEREASSLREQLLKVGRERQSALTQEVDDVLFFRTIGQRADLVKQIEAEAARYAGTPLEGGFKDLSARQQTAMQDWDRPRQVQAAERMFLRAKDYVEGEKGRLAYLFFESVSRRFPDTDEADQSRAYMERLQAGGPPKEDR
jgi:pSer/pThr/pTyr-binding forkhead associated (FHA) protein